MAHADRPISPYAEPSVRVDYIQQLSPSASPTNSSSDNGNLSTSSSSWTNTQHQSTTTPLQTAAMAGGWQLADLPWFDNPFSLFPSSPSSSTGTAASAGGGHNQQQQQQRRRFMVNSSNQTFLGWWTYPYFLCSSRRWLITYSIPVHQQQQAKIGDRSYYLFLSINQFAIYNLQLIGWTDCWVLTSRLVQWTSISAVNHQLQHNHRAVIVNLRWTFHRHLQSLTTTHLGP